MNTLNNSTVARCHRPIRILQFGEGNFLRAFADWVIDASNEKGVTDCGIAIVKPRAGKSDVINTLAAQDYMYHVYLQGIADGRPAQTLRLVTAVEDAFIQEDRDKFEHYILSPDLRFIISNTTEAGIKYAPDNICDDMPVTFPGKITNLLWRRFRHFGGDKTKGLYFLCCELIEDNGSTLKEYVIRHAREAKLGEDFIRWVESYCVFADTLVDRIVTGAPGDEAETLREKLGYDDKAIVMGELYHLWVIRGDGVMRLKEELPLDKTGLNVTFMPSIKEFRDKKVRILNGSHTALTPIGLLAGCETVRDAFETPEIKTFINSMMEWEVLPAIGGDLIELRKFADGILERFLNPYLKHYLKSIALNSLSKWETRNFCTAADLMLKYGRKADHELFSFAALLALYAPDSGFIPEDHQDHVDLIRRVWNDNDLEATVDSIVCHSDIFTVDFESLIPGFCSEVAGYLAEIRESGILASLRNFIK